MQQMNKLLTKRIEDIKNNIVKDIFDKEEMFKSSLFKPSQMWNEAITYFEYIFDLTPEHLLNIRLHTELITGKSVYAHAHKTYRFLKTDKEKEDIPMIAQYKYYIEDIPKEYWCSEPVTTPQLEMLGVSYKGKLVNENIVRYQSCITNLYKLGYFSTNVNKSKRRIAVEVGGGYGGLTHQLQQLCKNTTLIVIDFPEMLYFSAIYYLINNPEKKILILTKENKEELKNVNFYDAVFIPNYFVEELYNLDKIDLFINMLSFQEMTTSQIQEYLKLANEKLNGIFYSDNFRKHWLNKEISVNLDEIFTKYLDIKPALHVYDSFKENSIARINLLCKHFGLSPNSEYIIKPIQKNIKGDNYIIDLETNDVEIISKEL